ncbi:cold-regulated protein 28-like isoform X2 [Musa acuminata AAA Group]|uniref:cold-regulated protein 28-like isoform X2 n=1 Tax=Musa acuminata AAA Group TaxID=214697 RepID=UPI0031D133C0
MGDISSNRPSTAEISAIEGPSKVADSVSKGWTDEKHTLFLNSIEASFVNELYNEHYHSKAFQGWLSRTKEHKGSTGPSENDMKYGQFKVLRKGCWKNLRFEMDNNHAAIENGSFPLHTNPWVQHFRSPYNMKKKHLKSSDRDDDTEFNRICHQDSIDSSTEVSDQNFIADELIVGQQSSRICRKRRRGTAPVDEPIEDQVVPSRKALVTTISDVNHACPHPANFRSDATTCEVIASIVPPETALHCVKIRRSTVELEGCQPKLMAQSSGHKI